MLAVMAPSGAAQADVCVNVGRRVSVSGCANIADAIAPYVPPPAEYARCPRTTRRPAAAPNVNVCANVGRRISVSGCV
ncbi:hypothetical protein I551_4987 [Mycobacterium ulcerans str. Harvey]|uniref:RNA-binding protein n=1 Tax=Mycobacterium ulcerans str. Harvey TaxID=1299332 RepID=A0ABN0QUQ7_MYCUL|nr:hypothetical protein I551_4987 [Mycobacterium ulcerans str. Harvey]